ncbi:hypothetical protein KJ766_00610, partial [Patescibacteria group bacterium]|nr:hypothetical protein [Patescibacteria group bacterium]
MRISGVTSGPETARREHPLRSEKRKEKPLPEPSLVYDQEGTVIPTPEERRKFFESANMKKSEIERAMEQHEKVYEEARVRMMHEAQARRDAQLAKDIKKDEEISNRLAEEQRQAAEAGILSTEQSSLQEQMQQ